MTIALRVAALLLAAAAAGCEGGSEPPPSPPATRGPESAPSAWRVIDGSPQVALPAQDESALREAIEEARRTAEAARRRWEAAGSPERGRWAVRWAAPTIEGAVEHVWVVPVLWSAHRVEGRLASPPQRDLACGRGLGELVAFPAGELTDWVRYASGDPAGPREGGFTIDALEARFGRAR